MKLSILVVGLVLVLGGGCGDDGPVVPDAGGADAAADAGAGGGCRGNGDCTFPGETCYGPDDVSCGIPPRERCIGDEECGKEVCHAIDDSCSQDGIGSECAPPCTDGQCGAGFECSAGGGCRPLVCGTGGVECPEWEVCDPRSVDPAGPVHEITHGCRSINCLGDEACPGTTRCVQGRCQSGLGTCSPPAP